MLQPGEIKKEKSPLKCTCKHEQDEEAKSSDSVRQVLVNFGLNRKKVFTLSKKEKLHERFKNYILSEPAFSELLEDSYVVFQVFCPKFRTWVDIDDNETLDDGTVLNAVFFPSNIERDESNPCSLKKKEVLFVNENTVKRSCRNKIIHIDLEDENDVTGTPIKNSKRSKSVKSSKVKEEDDEEEEEKRKKIKKSTTDIENVTEEEKNLKKIKKLSAKNKIVTEEETEKPDNSNSEEKIKSKTAKEQKNIQNNKSHVSSNEAVAEETLENAVDSKLKKAKTSEMKEELNQEEAKRSVKDQTVNVSSTSLQFDVQEPPEKRYSSYPENAYNSGYHNGFRYQQRRRIGNSPRNYGEKYVSKIRYLCSRRHWPEPEFSVKENPFGGFSCELKLNNKIYIGQHRFCDHVREAAAEEAYFEISYDQRTSERESNRRSWRYKRDVENQDF